MLHSTFIFDLLSHTIITNKSKPSLDTFGVLAFNLTITYVRICSVTKNESVVYDQLMMIKLVGREREREPETETDTTNCNWLKTVIRETKSYVIC